MAAVQLNFSLRTSANCKTVHLLGSWDKYTGQLPLAKDAAKSGGWKGTFRFPATTVAPGQRYWYYYIIDGHHVSHDPARDAVTEPTTGRKLNTLDIPAAAPAAKAPTSKSARQSRRTSIHVVRGRALSPSQIRSPIPTKPHNTVERLGQRLAAADLASPDASDSDSDSDASDVPSLNSSHSSRSSASSTPSSVSSGSATSSCCSCERYGITRAGNRIKLDCGGKRCAGDDDDDGSASDCSSDEEVASPSRSRPVVSRRHGVRS